MMERYMDMDVAVQWAEYARTHPEWEKIHTRFINAHIDKALAEIEMLPKAPAGREKIAELYGIKNRKGYPEIFRGV